MTFRRRKKYVLRVQPTIFRCRFRVFFFFLYWFLFFVCLFVLILKKKCKIIPKFEQNLTYLVEIKVSQNIFTLKKKKIRRNFSYFYSFIFPPETNEVPTDRPHLYLEGLG